MFIPTVLRPVRFGKKVESPETETISFTTSSWVGWIWIATWVFDSLVTIDPEYSKVEEAIETIDLPSTLEIVALAPPPSVPTLSKLSKSPTL